MLAKHPVFNYHHVKKLKPFDTVYSIYLAQIINYR